MKKSNGKGFLFNTIQIPTQQRNKFDLTHDVKYSGKMGELTPVLVMEVVPGDHVSLGNQSLVRFAPMIAPMMHRVDMRVEYFYVPNQMVWPNWEDFIMGNSTGGIPTIEVESTLTDAQDRFLDYMGVPPFDTAGGIDVRVNAIPFAAYQKIYNDYYRDQNQIAAVDDQLADGNQAAGTLLDMRLRAWEHDYLTSALDTPQAGDAVDIPLGDVSLKSAWVGISPMNPPRHVSRTGVAGTGDIHQDGGGVPIIELSTNLGDELAYDPNGTLEVDPVTITTLRRAFKLQEFLELLGRSGKRYIEFLRAFFNVKSQDLRLQRPEYIVGVKSPIVISEVLNTTGSFDATDPTSPPQGNMSGHGVGRLNGRMGSYTCPDYGYIIGIASVIPRTAYQQGIPKHYLKRDFTDYYFKQFANIGEQPITQDEVMAYHNGGGDTFGYIPRYSEYKYMPGRVAGDFRTTLNYWHLGRIFATPPSLSQEFLEVDPADQDRIFAVQDGTDYLYCHMVHQISANRAMEVYGNPYL